jgi:hypothetical protein
MYPDKDALISDLMHNVCEIVVQDNAGKPVPLRVTLMQSEIQFLSRKELKEHIETQRADPINLQAWNVWKKEWMLLGYDRIISIQTVPSY